VTAEGEEAILERRARGFSRSGLGQESADRSQGPAPVSQFADALDLAKAESLQPVGFLPGLLEALEIDYFGKVEKRTGD
jgi:hypothetical protein